MLLRRTFLRNEIASSMAKAAARKEGTELSTKIHIDKKATGNVIKFSFLTAVASRYYVEAKQFSDHMPPSEWHIKLATSRLNPAMRSKSLCQLARLSIVQLARRSAS